MFLALDEQLQFHERLSQWLGDGQSSGRVFGTFRNWNDLVVMAYGVVALPVFAWMIPALLRVPRVVELMALGLVSYACHTAVDSVAEPPTGASMAIEESFKLLTSAFLALSTFAGLLGMIASRAPTRARVDGADQRPDVPNR